MLVHTHSLTDGKASWKKGAAAAATERSTKIAFHYMRSTRAPLMLTWLKGRSLANLLKAVFKAIACGGSLLPLVPLRGDQSDIAC